MKTLKLLVLSASVMAAGSAYANHHEEDVVIDQDIVVVDRDTVNSAKDLEFLHKPYAVRAEVGLGGYGGAIEYAADPYVSVEAGFSSADEIDEDFEVDSITDEALGDIGVDDVETTVVIDPNKNAWLGLNYRPFQGWFTLSTGVLMQDNAAAVRIASENANAEIEIDNRKYNISSIGDISADFEFENEFAPYVGIGFSPAITNTWGLFGQIGAAFTGDTSYAVSSTKPDSTPIEVYDQASNQWVSAAALNAPLQNVADVKRRIADEIGDSGTDVGVLPIAKIGLMVRF